MSNANIKEIRSEITAAITRASGTLNQLMDRAASTCEGFEWDMQRVQETNRDLASRLEAADKAYKDLVSTAVKQQNEQFNEMTDKLSAERQESQRLRSQLETQASNVAMLKANLKAMEEYAVKVQGERDALLAERIASGNKATAVLKENREQARRLDALTHSLKIMAELYAEQDARLTAMTKQKEDLDEDYGRLSEANEKLQRRYEQLLSAAASLRPCEVLITKDHADYKMLDSIDPAKVKL